MTKIESLLVKEPLPDEASLPPPFDLSQHGITVRNIRRNLSPAALYSDGASSEIRAAGPTV